jgi:hypothetical protein
MRMPEAGPLGETFFEARERAMTGALFVKRSFGGCVESVVTFFTQRFFAGTFFFSLFATGAFFALRAEDFFPPLAGAFFLAVFVEE